MAVYTKTTTKNGQTQYRNKTENKIVSEKDLQENHKSVYEELQLADEGTEVDSETVTDNGSGVTNPDGTPKNEDDRNKNEDPKQNEEPVAPANPTTVPETKDEVTEEDINPYRRKVPESEKGMGFNTNKAGKTVDIFDGKTPHTHLRLVAGMPVPLSEENYKTKSDAEIYDRLHELKVV